MRAVTDPAGRTTEYTYNANGQVATAQTSCCGTVAYAYDAVGWQVVAQCLTLRRPCSRMTNT